MDIKPCKIYYYTTDSGGNPVKDFIESLNATQARKIARVLSYIERYGFEQHLKKLLKKPGFRKEWEDSEVEYQLACRLIEARFKSNLSQRELAKKVHTSQAAISRIEAMHGNPSLSLLKRIAQALGTTVKISFS